MLGSRRLVAFTDRHVAPHCITVPAPGPAVCALCRRPIASRDEEAPARYCASCRRLGRSGSALADLVVPAALYSKHGTLAGSLWRYKNSIPPDRAARTLVASLLARFVAEHRRCIEAVTGSWDAVTVVPSTRARGGWSPVDSLVPNRRILPEDRLRLEATGLPIGRNSVAPGAFRLVGVDVPRAVLVIDDTYTSGSHLHSAAAALKSAGVGVVVGVPVGRIIDQPRDSSAHAPVDVRPYDFRRCALCAARPAR